ncbi:MAG: hypothetical protein CVU46_00585 [Chloroflexi bacterium HGW-Chloroflexi-8]|nr:MAG: hypothetical protein CVU46_00585 [Chloroflexi bacterium HGW-Chloroflexi-8]
MQKSFSRHKKEKPDWMNRHLFLLIITLLVFTVSIGWGDSPKQTYAVQSATDPGKPEYVAFVEVCHEFQAGQTTFNEVLRFDQTNRVILGGLMVMIILISTVIYGYFIYGRN